MSIKLNSRKSLTTRLNLVEVAKVQNKYIAVNGDQVKIYNDVDSLLKEYKTFKMFTKADRSSFHYWFAHWCGYNMTALNLGIWKFKYLFHDIEKPWLKLFLPYDKVKKFHREHSKHHLEYGLKHGFDKVDWEALLIDWECCGLSKQETQMDARETMAFEISKLKWARYSDTIVSYLKPLLDKYML